MSEQLQLRDIHLPPEPSWWPPAPGWWLLAAIVLVALWWIARLLLARHRAARRRASLRAEFDAAVALPEPRERIAAISQLLRRAAVMRDPAAAVLHGDDWLRFLDGEEDGAPREFSAGPGRALLDAPYRANQDSRAIEALLAPARWRFLDLVEAA